VTDNNDARWKSEISHSCTLLQMPSRAERLSTKYLSRWKSTSFWDILCLLWNGRSLHRLQEPVTGLVL